MPIVLFKTWPNYYFNVSDNEHSSMKWLFYESGNFEFERQDTIAKTDFVLNDCQSQQNVEWNGLPDS